MPPRKNIGRLALLQRETKVPDPYVLTPEIIIAPPTREQMQVLTSTNGEESNAALCGDQWEAVRELFAAQPVQLWNAFIADVQQHFFGPGVNDVEGKSEDSSEL